MTGIKCNLKQTVEIGEASLDPRVKLEARRTANDCYRIIMDLATSSGVISEALKWINQTQEHVESLKKMDQRTAGIWTRVLGARGKRLLTSIY